MRFSAIESLTAFLVPAILGILLSGCKSGKEEVVVYTALDQVYSEPILKDFEQETGIACSPVYDVEANKTVGLYTRLVEEEPRPRCDVFWNNEIVHTIRLKNLGILEPYKSPSAQDIPASFRDEEGTWTGFAARARIVIYNREILPEAPQQLTSLNDLTDPKWKDRAALARPLFGTTATHAAVLAQAWGLDSAEEFFRSVLENGIRIESGNASVRDVVAAGSVPWGFTDTDDANGAIEDGKPVGILFPDQDGEGTLLIPNTLALIRDCPHPENARKLIDYLLRPEVEQRLANCRSAQIPVRSSVPGPPALGDLSGIRWMEVNFGMVASVMEDFAPRLRDIFHGN